MWSKRMSTQPYSLTLTEDAVRVVDEIATRNETSRSKIVNLAILLMNTYFDKDQIDIEFNSIKHTLGRKKRQPSV